MLLPLLVGILFEVLRMRDTCTYVGLTSYIEILTLGFTSCLERLECWKSYVWQSLWLCPDTRITTAAISPRLSINTKYKPHTLVPVLSYFKATFSFHKLIPKHAQMTTLYTNLSLYITFTMIYYIRQEKCCNSFSSLSYIRKISNLFIPNAMWTHW